MEQWKTIPEFPDYQISNLGNVMRMVNRPFNPACICGTWKHSTGCLCVTLRQGGKRKSARVHILVAKAFIPNPYGLPTVNHVDGDKTHNDYDNLEWASYRRQSIHAIQTGLHKTKGYSYHKSAHKWVAYIESETIKYYLGCFGTEAEAKAARYAAEIIYHNLKEIS